MKEINCIKNTEMVHIMCNTKKKEVIIWENIQ